MDLREQIEGIEEIRIEELIEATEEIQMGSDLTLYATELFIHLLYKAEADDFYQKEGIFQHILNTSVPKIVKSYRKSRKAPNKETEFKECRWVLRRIKYHLQISYSRIKLNIYESDIDKYKVEPKLKKLIHKVNIFDTKNQGLIDKYYVEAINNLKLWLSHQES